MIKKLKYLLPIFLYFLFLPCIVNGEEIEFKPVNYYGDFKVDSHYIITTYNSTNNKWYALGSTETGQAKSIEINNPTNGLKIDKSEVKTSNYILTCSKKEDYYSIKLRSNILDETTGKKYSLYVGNNQMFNLGGGTIHLSYDNHDSNNFFRIGRKQTALQYNEDTNEFYYSEGFNFHYQEGKDVLILSDADLLLRNPEPQELKKVKSVKRMITATNHKKYDAFQLVYKDTDGINYMLTSNGAKKVDISSESFTTDDYLYFDNDNEFHYSGADEYCSGYSDAHLVSNDKYLYINNDSLFSNSYDSLYPDIKLYYQKRTYTYNSHYPIMWFTDPISIQQEASNDFFDEMHENETMRYKLRQGNYYIGWDRINKNFIPVTNIDDGVLFDYYSNKTIYDLTYVNYYNEQGTLLHSIDTYGNDFSENPYWSWTESLLLGWTDDIEKAGYIEREENENLFVYNPLYGTVKINDNIINKYSIKEKLSDCKKENDTVNLYPILTINNDLLVKNYIGSNNNKKIIGVSDWKNTQENKTDEYLDEHEKHQGSINIEVYLDGKIWLPQEKVYFRYDNDDAADLNIKFLNDNISDIDTYLTSKDDFQASPYNYKIVSVYAEQGNSEEGLYEKFNWMSQDGGQLDNVKGGSTVKIYLTSKYTAKYYFNDELYKVDELLYTPTATKKAVANNSKNSEYIINDNSNNSLLNKTEDITFFKSDKIGRGKFVPFNYELLEERDTMTVFELPTATLTYDVWLVKDKEQEVVGKAEENGLIQIEDKEKVDYLYIGDDDSIDTIHLYAYTKDFKNSPKLPEDTPFITSSGTYEEDDTPTPTPTEEKTSIVDLFNSNNPITGDKILTFFALAVLSIVILIISTKKKRKSSSVIY